MAQGELDAAFACAGSHDWDLAAADLLVHEAGGVLTDFTGRPLKYNGIRKPLQGALVAAGQARHDALIGLVRDRGIDLRRMALVDRTSPEVSPEIEPCRQIRP